ncbi:MAG: hypothetical protein ABWY11_27300 [Umezawaea sp.]
MKIRAEDLVFHLNDYHFIHLYRNVNASTIHTSTSLHEVLLDEFQDWNGLAVAAAKSKKADFAFDRIKWMKKGSEIFPVDSGNAVGLSGPDIQTLVSYLNDGVGVPAGTRTKDFERAHAVVESMLKKKASRKLDFQWPNKLPAGVRHKDGRTTSERVDHFVWGPNGDAEYPHVHLFLSLGGVVTEGRATLVPARGASSKRGVPLLHDLTFDRSETVPSDEKALLELEKVMRCVVYGEDFTGVPTKSPEKAEVEDEVSEDESAAYYQSFALAWNVTADWVASIFPACGIELAELGEFGPKDLVAMANPVSGPPRFTVPDKAFDTRNNEDY